MEEEGGLRACNAGICAPGLTSYEGGATRAYKLQFFTEKFYGHSKTGADLFCYFIQL